MSIHQQISICAEHELVDDRIVTTIRVGGVFVVEYEPGVPGFEAAERVADSVVAEMFRMPACNAITALHCNVLFGGR